MIPMAQMVRHCPDCGSDRPFEQYHAESYGSCTACGAALFIGFVPYVGETSRMPDIRDRVA